MERALDSNRHDQTTGLILPFRDLSPVIAPDAWIAPGAVVAGDVGIGSCASIWFGAIVRGDVGSIEIGENTNIQDGSVIHVSLGKPGTRIGANVTVGHMALLHACVVEDGCLIGMKACVSDEAVVEKGAMVAAGALVTPRTRVPSGELWGGAPARFMRPVTDREKAYIEALPARYVSAAAEYRRRTG
jgi:gamma-carbonic anhydrase